MTEVALTEVRFDDLPAPLAAHDRVDGMVVLRVGERNDYIPFGRDVSESGLDGTADTLAVWSWDGDRESPTLEPSIDLPEYHRSIRNGEPVPD